MGAGLIAFFTALPAFIQLLSQLGNLMQRLVSYAQTNNLNKWINDLEDATTRLENAKSAEEKLAAAQFFAGLTRNLGPK